MTINPLGIYLSFVILIIIIALFLWAVIPSRHEIIQRDRTDDALATIELALARSILEDIKSGQASVRPSSARELNDRWYPKK